jgi:hypothetical protein
MGQVEAIVGGILWVFFLVGSVVCSLRFLGFHVAFSVCFFSRGGLVLWTFSFLLDVVE